MHTYAYTHTHLNGIYEMKMKQKQAAAYPISHYPMSRCRPDQFNCKADPDSCIDMSLVCNGIRDCFDASDERDCGHVSSDMRNRSKKDDIAANKLAKLIGLLNEQKKNKNSTFTRTHTKQNKIALSLSKKIWRSIYTILS